MGLIFLGGLLLSLIFDIGGLLLAIIGVILAIICALQSD